MAENEKKKFKDWFDTEAVKRLSDQVYSAWPEFDQKRFQSLATDGLEDMEMSGRVDLIAASLANVLPEDKAEALRILSQSLPEILPDCEAVTDGWLQWPVGAFIATYGTDDVDAAFDAMIELTQRFSSEFAIRPFAVQDPEDTFSRLKKLTGHPSAHVRRWCSEGIRPRLPWGGNLKSLIEDPSPIWPILEDLKQDSELYVRRSVANNLNDIAKDHPDAVLDRCEAWWGQHEDTDHLIRHALRTLIKDGHPRALALLGYHAPGEELGAKLSVTPRSIQIGESITLNLTLQNKGKDTLAVLVDFGVEYVRKQGTSGKVFKWSTRELKPGEELSLTKRHAFRETSIRALYPGKHGIWVQANGVRIAQSSFTLTAG